MSPIPQTGPAGQLRDFIDYCERKTGLNFANYREFDFYSVSQYREFWSLFLDWSGILCEGDREPVCVGDDCETAVFWPALRLNYAENLLNRTDDDVSDGATALVGCHTDGRSEVLSRGEVRDKVVRFAGFLRRLGVAPGDRVVAISRNNIEVVIAALASTAIGAVFSSCAHDMGAFTALARFQPLKPKILIAN